MITALIALFAVGTFWFWILLILATIVITAFVENENGFWATTSFVVAFAALVWGYKYPLVATVKASPMHAVWLVLGYFAIGAVWSIAKWFFYVHKKRCEYRDYKRDFLHQRGVTILTPQLANELDSQISHSYRSVKATPPSASEHKDDLILWSSYWPFSILGTLLNDIVRKIWTHVYELLHSTYQRISDGIFEEATSDMKMAEEFRNTQQ